MSSRIDLNAAADPQNLAPPKRGRGRPRKNPPPPNASNNNVSPHAPPPPQQASQAPDPTVHHGTGSGPGLFSPGDLVWGKKLNHPSWPGQVISAASTGAQFLVSFFGEKALAWCDATQLRPYQPYFPVGELYDGEADDFDAAVEDSLHEFSRRVQAALTAPASSSAAFARPFLPAEFVALLHDLAADRMGFSNRLQAAVAKAHLRAFDSFRAVPAPPEFTLELGIPNADPLPNPHAALTDSALSDCSLVTPSSRRRGRKRKEEAAAAADDSDEDWDPRKKAATDSDSDVGVERRRGSRGRGSGAPTRGRPRGRPRKTDAARAAQLKDEEIEEEAVDYPPAAEMFLQLTSVAADPFNFKGYDSVPIILSFFLKYKGLEALSARGDKNVLTLGGRKGRNKMAGSMYPTTKAEGDSEVEDGHRGRRKSAGSIYSARKAEDSYWCDIIINDFDDGDTSSDYEGGKRKRVSQNKSGNKKMKQDGTPQEGASTDHPAAKPADGSAALILHFSNADAIPSVDDINSIFRIHGPIMEGATEITKNSKIAKVVFSKSADAERAYSSSGKYNAFGPALISSDIKYLPPAPQVP